MQHMSCKFKSNLKKHISSVNDKVRIQCVVCGDYFLKGGYYYHIKYVHKELNCFVKLNRLIN